MQRTRQVVIITGSSSGIGRAISLQFAKEGAKIICADLTPGPPNQLDFSLSTHEEINSQQTPGQAIFVCTDVSKQGDMENLINQAVAHFGRLDVLVNNAGISLKSFNHLGPKAVNETDEETYVKTMDINAKSVFLGCKYAVRQFLSQELDHGGSRGYIVNIASIYGLAGSWGHGMFYFFNAIPPQSSRFNRHFSFIQCEQRCRGPNDSSHCC